MDWWIWILIGLVLLVVEIATPGGFFFVFFGASALVVGMLTALMAAELLWVQLLLFSVMSVLSLVLFRKRLLARINASSRKVVPVDNMVGETAIVLEDLAPGACGKAEFRGTTWNTRNAGAVPLAKGQRCKVDRVDGLTLWISIESVRGGES